VKKVGSLFSGIGGFDLGLENAGFKIAWQVEIDEYASRVLAKHWPHIPRYRDIRNCDWEHMRPVDVLCGGFPCQDLSFAGRRAGIDGERSGLWSEYVRAIRTLRPHYIIVENVPGLLTNAYMGRVLGDLAESGYDAEWDCLPASAFGAHHRRDRVWIVAYPKGSRCEGDEILSPDSGSIRARVYAQSIRSGGFQKWEGWATESRICRVADGIPNRTHRLKALGNAIVPQIAEALGRMILEAEKEALCDAPNVVA
jgi:DNA (cytosine-5)-methyltransferase 1